MSLKLRRYRPSLSPLISAAAGSIPELVETLEVVQGAMTSRREAPGWRRASEYQLWLELLEYGGEVVEFVEFETVEHVVNML